MTPANLMRKALGEPTLLPVWPKSDKLALVCVEYNESDKTVVMSVLHSTQELENKLSEDNDIRKLFFQMLKSDLGAPKK